MLFGCLAVVVLSFFPFPIFAGLTTSPSDVANKTFDYIIVGGGLTGLTVAGRLAEDPSVTVLVVEAGADDRQNPIVYDIYKYGKAFGTSLDWSWPTDMGRSMVG
jgi:choline dehydrogenase